MDTGAAAFSSRDLAEKDRIAVWREVYGHTILRLDIEPLRDRAFEADIQLRALPGLKLVSGTIQGTRDRRTRALMADGNDDFGLAFNVAGVSSVSQCGHDVALGAGEGVLLSCSDVGAFLRPSPSHYVGLRLPRAPLKALVPNAEDLVGRLVPRTGTTDLLLSYSQALLGDESLSSGALQNVAVNHVFDLVVLALGSSRDPSAREGGLRAARLAAIKADIAARFSSPSLSLETIASRHRVTPRYVQILFERDGTTFSQFLMSRRLEDVRRALVDPRGRERPIASIAYDAGFADISTFNRAFRRRFGMTPSDMRAGNVRRH